MLRPSETANDLFRRLNNDVFDLRLSQERTEKLQFGSTIEVQSRSSEITEFVLGCSMDFASQFEAGVIFHVSIGNNMFNSVVQSKINIASTSLHRMHLEGRVKSVIVPSLLHLLASIEFLKLSLRGEKALIIFEGCSTLFLMHKANTAVLAHDTLMKDTFACLQALVRSQLVIAVWVNAETPKTTPSLRDGPGAAKDPLNILWKQNVPKLLVFTSH